jgi:hypothetical protein
MLLLYSANIQILFDINPIKSKKNDGLGDPAARRGCLPLAAGRSPSVFRYYIIKISRPFDGSSVPI